MELQCRARRLQGILMVLERATAPDAVLRAVIREGAREARAIEFEAGGMAGWLNGPVSALAYAEEVRDWDRLADLRCAFTSGRLIAGELIPLLDVIRGGSSASAVREARGALEPWFETFGRELLRRVVLTEVGLKLRAPVLVDELERWQRSAAPAVAA
jgi:hypothetical protein